MRTSIHSLCTDPQSRSSIPIAVVYQPKGSRIERKAVESRRPSNNAFRTPEPHPSSSCRHCFKISLDCRQRSSNLVKYVPQLEVLTALPVVVVSHCTPHESSNCLHRSPAELAAMPKERKGAGFNLQSQLSLGLAGDTF